MHIGDQASEPFLRSVLKAVEGGSSPGFDIIIDDGGHTMEMQQVRMLHVVLPMKLARLSRLAIPLAMSVRGSVWCLLGKPLLRVRLSAKEP